MSKLQFTHHPHPSPVPAAKRADRWNPGFGKVFNDHMVTIRYERRRGWHDATLGPRAPITLDPAAAVLHYAQEIFEGLKAYARRRQRALFRPDENARRFKRRPSASRCRALPEEMFVEAVRQLVRADRDWIPDVEGGSLYLRPFMFATEVFLGVRPATEYKFLVIASPAATTSSRARRRCRSGSRRTTPAPRRAAPAPPSAAATTPPAWSPRPRRSRHGHDQVVFLDAAEQLGRGTRRHERVLRVRRRHAGRRRRSPARSCPASPATACSRSPRTRADRARGALPIDQWRADAGSGRLRECFACGTAAVVTPIGTVRAARRRVHHRQRRPGHPDRGAEVGPGRHPARPRARPAQVDPQGFLERRENCRPERSEGPFLLP